VTVRARIAAAFAANAFGQAVTVGSQLLLIPLYFRFWGAPLYGEWLILSSIPAYLTMADLGIGSAAGNQMTMQAAGGEWAAVRQTLRAAGFVALLSALAVMLFAAGAAGLAWWAQVPRTLSMAPAQAALVLVGLGATVALGFAGGVVSAAYRCCDRNAQGILWANVTRLAEAVALGVLLLAGQGPVALCAAMVVVRAVALVLQWAWLRRLCPWLFEPGAVTDLGVVRRLAGPALGFMAFPLGNALALQGPVLVIGAAYGGAAVAMFSALRTLARIPVQLTNMFNASVWPEMSRAFGEGNLVLMRHLHRAAWGMTAWLTLTVGAGLVALGPWLVRAWLGAAAPFDPLVFGLLVLLTAASALWNASSVVLAATNSHLRLGALYVISAGLGLACAMGLARFGWPGLMAGLIAAECVLLAWVLPAVLRLTQDSFSAFAAVALRPGAWRKPSA
jgi:O-antigen/teichoic acid export membrane protein